MSAPEKSPAAAVAGHTPDSGDRFQKFRLVPFLDERKRPISALWHDPEMTGGYPLAYFNRETASAKKAQSVIDLLNSVERLERENKAMREAMKRAEFNYRSLANLGQLVFDRSKNTEDASIGFQIKHEAEKAQAETRHALAQSQSATEGRQ